MPKHVQQYSADEGLPPTGVDLDLALYNGELWEWREGEGWYEYVYSSPPYTNTYTASVDPTAYLNVGGGVEILLDDDISIDPSYGPGVAIVQLTQDGFGGHAVTLNFPAVYAGGTPPVLTTTAGATDILFFVASGEANWCLIQAALNVS